MSTKILHIPQSPIKKNMYNINLDRMEEVQVDGFDIYHYEGTKIPGGATGLEICEGAVSLRHCQRDRDCGTRWSRCPTFG